MPGDQDQRAEEIIIVRRRHDEGDHHHGGVWKIAFADFMTAMMAFFLVMWLINAANTETRASVASYFNPVKLTDSVIRKKGLLDLDEKANADADARKSIPGSGSGKDTKDNRSKDKKDSLKPAKDKTGTGGGEQAGGTARTAPPREPGAATPEAARQPGRAFRDPFAPFTSPRQVASDGAAGQDTAVPPEAPRGEVKVEAKVDAKVDASRSALNAATAAAVTETLTGEAVELLRQVHSELRRLGMTGGPAIDVTIEGNNIVVSLTDTSSFGMFSVGSAEPSELLVRLMETITPILSAQGDQIILRGHTDARPYRSDARNNNWRLAMARAEAAYAMLLRSGIEESRFERIEAYADRKPKVAADPQAAANRRIEIIMRRGSR